MLVERWYILAKLGEDASNNVTESATNRGTGGESCECNGSRAGGREGVSQDSQLEWCSMRITLVCNRKGMQRTAAGIAAAAPIPWRPRRISSVTPSDNGGA